MDVISIRGEADGGLYLVPPHLRDGLMAHVMTGRPVGHFLTAVLENDLRESVARADEQSLAGLRGLIQFLHNFAPGQCWGSPAKVTAWRRDGGATGKAAA